jgi:drug/metabolite transporter (DMT)-like permease
MALIMALTESGMNVLLRSLDWKDAAKSVWVVNGGASLWLLGARLLQGLFDGKTQQWGLESGTWWDAIMLTAFHGISMFSGYWLRFFAIPRLSVVTYAMLSYAGLLASYLFGMLFVGERPGWISIVGATIIVISGLLLQTSAGSAA